MKKLEFDEFLRRAKTVYGNKYDYSLVVLKNNFSKIKIICPQHGVFEKIVKNFLKGSGCQECLKDIYRQHWENYLEKVKSVYNERFEVSKIVRLNKTKIKVFCEKHGFFEVNKNYFLEGLNCRKCKEEERFEREELKKNNVLQTKLENLKSKYDLIKKKRNDENCVCLSKEEDCRYLKNQIVIVCRKHGNIKTSVYKILKQQHCCKKCQKENKKLKKEKKTIEDFMNFLQNRFPNQFSFIKLLGKKISLKCIKHGELITSISYTKEFYCKECKKESSFVSNDEIIEKIKKVHGDKYVYSFFEKKGKKVLLFCKKHHKKHEQTLNNCLKGCSLSCCAYEIRAEKTSDRGKKIQGSVFRQQANNIHNNMYVYFIDNDKIYKTIDKIKIICKKHGEFEQKIYNHLKGCKCRLCSYENKNKYTLDDFIDKSRKIHKNKYDYSLVKYIHSHGYVDIICKKHGVFSQKAYYHLKGCNCPKCACFGSKIEKDFLSFLKETYEGKIIEKDRTNVFELDFNLPEINLAFEINGVFWHNEIYVDSNSHLQKTEICESKNIHLIHIYEDDLMLKNEIVKSRVMSLLKKNETIYARECSIKEISFTEKKDFLEKNHLQGDVISKINLGLFYENELVSTMILGSKRRVLGSQSKKNEYELLIFCNKLQTNVVGAASKLFKFFLTNFEFKEIISYADRSWMRFGNNIYDKLGFQFVSKTHPNYYYVVNQKREHRFKFRKDVLVKQGFDANKTEKQIMLDRKIYRIYDSGCLKYKYSKNCHEHNYNS